LQREFDGVFGTETIGLFLTTSYDQFAGQARLPTFLVLFAERFARQRLKALAKAEGKHSDGVPVVLLLCIHNAGRSQMALGWFNHLADGRAIAWSGGPEPGNELNAAAVAAMAEVPSTSPPSSPSRGPTRSSGPPTSSSRWGAATPARSFPGKRYEDWDLDDPAGQSLEAVRPIRDETRN
jgi:protein-tyrosine-phosphatase